VVSNSRLLRESLAALLAAHLDLRLVGSYSGSLPGGAALPNPADHVVLLDGALGRDAAVVWTRHWRALAPPAHVVVFELTDDADVILACIECGAGGYTLQGASVADLARTIRQVRQGQAECSPEVTARLFARLADQARQEPPGAPPDLTPPLTAREMEVLRYLAQDYSNQAIAAILVVEVRTVKYHVHNILEKLKLRHRWDAARYAAERGWIDAGPALYPQNLYTAPPG
jgi:two-component system nitrate/nitrite response regulator NarL